MAFQQVIDLSEEDRTWLRRTKEHILNVIITHYGPSEFNETEADLELCQRLLDDKFVAKKHLLEAQCIGVVLGNVVAAHLPKEWKRVNNEFGDMIALVDKETGFILYPLTMISKRLDKREKPELVLLYRDVSTWR